MFQKIIDNHLANAKHDIESSLLDFCSLFKSNPVHLRLIVENWEFLMNYSGYLMT